MDRTFLTQFQQTMRYIVLDVYKNKVCYVVLLNFCQMDGFKVKFLNNIQYLKLYNLDV